MSEQQYGEPGPPLERGPFLIGLLAGLGFALAWFVASQVQVIGSVLVLVVVSLFLAVGLSPAVEFFVRHRVPRPWALVVVICLVLLAIVLFAVAIVPVVTDQFARITENAPGWLDQLASNSTIRDLDEKYQVVDKVKEYVSSGDLWQNIFGGALSVGLKVLGFLANTFIVVVLTLYFLASLSTIKGSLYRLAPASRRDRVTRLGDQVFRGIGGYVSGAFVVALCAGISSLVFLVVAGMREYAVALAFVVAVLDVIPMIGATLGAVVVCAIGFATSPATGIVCVVFYVAYQQVENYVIYPKVMSRSVEIPGAATVIAALVGAALLGVIGALLAIPTAAAILLLVREVWVRRQDAR